MNARKATARLLGRHDVSVRIGASLFFAGAVLSVVAMAVPHSSRADAAGYYAMALVELAVAVTTLALSPRVARRHAPAVFPVAGALVVCGTLYFNGERVGGDAMLTELYLVWPALYAGYFCTRRAMLATVVLLAAIYAVTLAVIGPPTEMVVHRWIVTMSVVAGAAAALYVLRRHVERLVGALHAAARTDPLTGMLNRRGFEEHFALELERSARSGEPFALLLGDLDWFKGLNDRFGHLAGDEALAAIGEALRDACRAIDTAARIGGEEFVLLMPATGVDDGFEAAERLRMSVCDLSGPDGCPLTISFGVVEHPLHGDVWPELMRAADEALYAAKSGGRNRSVAYGGELQLQPVA
jgi:diguanylate cyclase (GGDEF)-like protein